MRITHHGKQRRTLWYWLTSHTPNYRWDVLGEAICPKCNQTIYEYFRVNPLTGPTHPKRVLQKQIPNWLLRMSTDFEWIKDTGYETPKNTAAKIYAGEFTLKAAKDSMRHYVLRHCT